MKKYIKYIIILLLVIGAFPIYSLISAEKKCSCSWGTYRYDVYRCAGDCPGQIKKEYWIGCWSSCCKSNPCRNYPKLTRTDTSVGESWQKCEGGPYTVCHNRRRCSTSSDDRKPFLVCSGKCLPNVSEVRYYNNPTFPQNPELTILGANNPPPICSATITDDCIEESKDPMDIKLPFKIDWDEDPYWQEGGFCSGDIGYFSCPLRRIGTGPDGSQSYVLTLDINSDNVSPPTKDLSTFSNYISKNYLRDTIEINTGYFRKILNLGNQPRYNKNDALKDDDDYIAQQAFRSSEYNFRVDHSPCWLKSGTTYTMRIQTCCNPDGTNCNDGGVFTFKTAHAPELKSPEDLDWEGPGFDTWDAWEGLTETQKRDKNFDLSEYKPFDWAKDSIFDASKKSTIKPPVLLDWCDSKEEEKLGFPVHSYELLLNVYQKNETTGKMEPVCPFDKKIAGGFCERARVLDVSKPTFYSDLDNIHITNNQSFDWSIKPCSSTLGLCVSPYGDYSQTWQIKTAESDLGEVKNIIPRDNAKVGVPIHFSWIPPTGYIYSYFELYDAKGSNPLFKLDQRGFSLIVPDAGIDFKIGETYRWRFKNCTDEKGEVCDNWSSFYEFTITGDPPKLIAPEGDIHTSRIAFDWENVEGADHYIFKINIDGNEIKQEAKYNTLNYEVSTDKFPLQVNQDYSWSVQTCADKDSSKCGDFSLEMTFKEVLGIPGKTRPSNESFTVYKNRSVDLTWEAVPGGELYEVSITKYKHKCDENGCEDVIDGQEIIKTTNTNSYTFMPGSLGIYAWKVRACLADDFCTKDWSNENKIVFYQDNISDITSDKYDKGSAPSPDDHKKAKAGLVPCGKRFDDPTTPWDETEKCEFKHVILLTRNIVDFTVWQFIPALIVIMLLYTAGLYFFTSILNAEIPNYNNIISTTKDIWKYLGLGFLILLVAWFVLDLILHFLGFDTGPLANFFK